MIRVEITAVVFPTEDASLVEQAILKIFPEAELESAEAGICGTTERLDRFIETLARQRIRDTAREVILKGRKEDTAELLLNKQTATVGKLSFSEPGESSLGDIRVRITTDEWERIIGELTPPVLCDGE